MIEQYRGVPLEKRGDSFYFTDLTLVATHYAKGRNESLRTAFMLRHNLTESKSRAFPPWLVLLPKGMRHYPSFTRNEGGAHELHRLMNEAYACDHETLFVKNGKYVYTSQPYDMDLYGYQAVESYWQNLGLFVGISITDAWWYPGRTPLLVIAQVPLELTGFIAPAMEKDNNYVPG
jgi:hypothetical protein